MRQPPTGFSKGLPQPWIWEPVPCRYGGTTGHSQPPSSQTFSSPQEGTLKPLTHSAATLLAPFPGPWQPPTRFLSLWVCLLWAFLMNVPVTCRAWLLATNVWRDGSQCCLGGLWISLPGSVGGCLPVGRAYLKHSPRTAATCLSVHCHRRPSPVFLQSAVFFFVFIFSSHLFKMRVWRRQLPF